MKNNCIFTIVAKNYVGLAQILESSVRQYHPDDVDYHIIIADEAAPTIREALPANVLVAKDICHYTEDEWQDMTFKYTLTEFCTAIKPAVFQYFLQKGYRKVVYFDPDIYVFAPLTNIFAALEQHDMVLTPHVANIHPHYQGESEWAICVTGIFNLGFCGVSNSGTTEKLMHWWRARLVGQAFCDRTVGSFTDQKWMDWVPAFLGKQLCILRDLGMNLAPWNIFEREIYVNHDDTLWVRPRFDGDANEATPLVFVHFSGYDYKMLLQHVIAHQRMEKPQEYVDMELATRRYSLALIEHQDTFLAYLSQEYSYGHYDNGRKIENFHRRLYNGLKKEGTVTGNPFGTGDGSFFQTLKRKSMLTKESIDSLTPQNVSGYDKKVSMLNRLFYLLYKLMGYHRYPLFVKSLHRFTQPENHTFLFKGLFQK